MSPGLGGRLAAALAAMMTALAGCGTLDSPAPGSGAGDLLAFYRYAGALDAETRQHEVGTFRNWVRGDRCGPDRIRLAMLVAHAGPEGEGEVPGILEPCLAGGQRPPSHLRNLAFLLKDQVERRRALRERMGALEGRIRSLEQGLSEARSERQELAAERRQLTERLESLKEQLEALKTIERSIRQRD